MRILSHPTLTSWLWSVMFGVAGALSLYRFLPQTSRPVWLLVLIALGLSCAAGSILFPLIRMRFTSVKIPAQRMIRELGILSLAIGLAAAFIPCHLPAEGYLRISATGQRNPAARGSEVWVNRVRLREAVDIPLEQLTYEQGWEIRNKALVSFEVQPAELVWRRTRMDLVPIDFQGKASLSMAAGELAFSDLEVQSRNDVTSEMIEVCFIAHPYSGYVDVASGKTIQTIDLYSPEQTLRCVVIPLEHEPAKGWLVNGITIWLGDTLVLAGLVQVLISVSVLGWRATRRGSHDSAGQSGLGGWTRQRLTLVLLGLTISGLGTTAIWHRGLSNMACEQGAIRIKAAAAGTDVLPLLLDAEVQEIIDIPLNRYQHQVRGVLRIAERTQPIAMIGIATDDDWLLPTTRLNLSGAAGQVVKAEMIDIPGCPFRGVWIERGGVQAFEFNGLYELANAVFYVQDSAASLELTIDGFTKTVSISTPDGTAGLVHVSLRPWQRPAGLIEYVVQLPAVRIRELGIADLPEGATCEIGALQVAIPNLSHLQPVRRESSIGGNRSGAALQLIDQIEYRQSVTVLSVVVFGLSTGILFVILWCAVRLSGSVDLSHLYNAPVAWWEYVFVVLCLALSLWLQTGVSGWFTADGELYISQALNLAHTGQVDVAASKHPPGYTSFLAAVFLAGGDGRTLWGVNTVVLLTGIVLAWVIGRCFGGRLGGVLVSLVMSVNPILLVASRLVLPDFLCSILIVGWFMVLVRWAGSRSGWSGMWALAAGIGCTLLASVRINAITLLGMGIVVPLLQPGSWWRRAGNAAVYLVIGGALYVGMKVGNSSHKLLAIGRLWPVVQQEFVALDSREFRPLRDAWLASQAHAHTWAFWRFHNIIERGDYQESVSDFEQVVPASLRRGPRLAGSAFLSCLRDAYLKAPDEQLYARSFEYESQPIYDDRFARNLKGIEGYQHVFHPDTPAMLASLKSEQPEASFSHDVVRWWLIHSRQWRLWPVTVLALLGLTHALVMRHGVLALPFAVNAGVVLPLCLLFTAYDRYFLPGEALLLIQAAVGIRSAGYWGSRLMVTRKVHVDRAEEKYPECF